MRLAGCVPQISFRELDAETLLPQALGISPYIDHVEFASGEMPIRHLNEAAKLIATGQARICLIAGGEAVRTSSRRRNQTSGPGGGTFQAARTASEIRRRYGLIHPVDIFRCTRTPPAPPGARPWPKARPRPGSSGR